MFGLDMFALDMLGNYESRKVERYQSEKLMVSTARVTDSNEPFETAVSHLSYRQGKIIIVETYSTRDNAKLGHAKWVATMTAEKLPESIKDVSSCAIVQLASVLGCDLNIEFTKDQE